MTQKDCLRCENAEIDKWHTFDCIFYNYCLFRGGPNKFKLGIPQVVEKHSTLN